MKLLFKYLKPFKNYMLLGLSIKVFGTLIELFIPYIMRHILDNVVKTESVKNIVIWGLGMVLCALLALISNIKANHMATKVARDCAENIRHDLFEKTMYLTGKQTDNFTIPSLESRLTSDTYHIHRFIGIAQRMGVRAPILLIGGVALTLFIDRTLALVMISTLPLIGITVYFVSKKGTAMYDKVQKSVDKMTRIVREDAQGIRVIKALSKTEYEKKRFDNANKELVADELKVGTTMAATNPAMSLFLNLGLVGVILVGAFLVRDAKSTSGTIIAFIQYFTLISMAMLTVTRIFVMYTRAAASANRIKEVLDSESDLPVYLESEFPKKDEPYHIVFDNVSFSYATKKHTLQNISFNVKHGGTLGIIGATGSGKSTIIQLLLRFYDINEGAIRINGRDIRTIPFDELHSMFGIVFQNDFIYSESIGENIKFGRDITEEQIARAANIAQASEFIESFSDRFEYKVTQKGTNLSGGQKQRLLISRALAANPQILILDDSSSALDYNTDAKLRKALKEALPDTTTIIIAQRVSSIMNCDTIIVLEEGKIYGIGDHEHLMNTCDIYREISDSQMGGVIVD